MRTGFTKLNRRSKKGTTLVELVVAMALTSIFAVVCVALINPIEKIYRHTEKLSRAQLIADTVIDSIRKECDDIKNDDMSSAWIAAPDSYVSDQILRNGTDGLKIASDQKGQILLIKKNNSYCEAIFACLPVTEANKSEANSNNLEGTYTGHAVDKLFEGTTDDISKNTAKGIVHFGYYQATDQGTGVYPLKAYDYTNPMMASSYDGYYVKLWFKDLTTRTESGAEFPSFVQCVVEVYEGEYSDDPDASSMIYSRTAPISFSANGSAPGSSYVVPASEMTDVKVTVFWDDDHNASGKRIGDVFIKLIYDDNEVSQKIPLDKDTYTFRFSNIEASTISIVQNPAVVNGYKPAVISQSPNGSFIVVNTIDAANVKLISGPDFDELIKAKNIVSIRFGSREELKDYIPDYASGYTNVSIDENDNSTSDYKLYFVPETGDPSRMKAFVVSEEGKFIANEDCSKMFYECKQLEHISGLNNIITDNTTSMYRMFMDCRKLTDIQIDQWNTENVVTFDGMFRNVCCEVDNNVKMIIDISSFSFKNCSHQDQYGAVHSNNARTGINKMFYCDAGTSRINTIIFPEGKKEMQNIPVLQSVFSGCKNLEHLLNFNDLDLTGIADASDYIGIDADMFKNCSSLTEVNFSNWNLSNENYDSIDKSIFSGLTKVEKMDLSRLNIKHCSSISGMFSGCYALKEIDLSGSDLSGLKSLENLFKDNKNLRIIDLDGCDTSSLESVKGMFMGCSNITKIDMSDFIGSSCTTIESLFEGCSKVTDLEIDGWNTINVTSMANTFKSCHTNTNDNFELSLDEFEFDNVSDMSGMFNSSGVSKIVFPESGASYDNVLLISGMFQNCKGLTTIEGFEDVEFSKVTDASSMFGGCSKLSSVDFGLDMPKVEKADHMFSNCTGLTTVDLELNLPQANDINSLFSGCDNLETVDLDLKMNKVTSLDGLFSGCSKLRKVDLKANAHSVTSVKNLFYGCTNLTEINADLKLSKVTNVDNMFNGCSSLEKADLNLDLSNVTSASGLFNGCTKLKTIDMSLKMPLVTNIDSMFKDCSSLETISITSSLKGVTNANDLFSGCTSLKTINADLDMPLVTNFDNMFNGCSSLETISVTSDLTSVISAKNLFRGCAKLTTINADLNMPEVKNIEGLFEGCSSLKTINSRITAPSVTKIDNLFADCISLESISTDCDFSGAISAKNLFSGCTKLKTISGNIIMPNVTNIDGMFSGCTSLEAIPFDIEYQYVTSAKNLFSGCSGLKTINRKLDLPLVTNIEGIFSDCTGIKTINSNIIMPKATKIDNMFNGCSSLETINSNMSFESATSAAGLFEGCSSLNTVTLDLDLPSVSKVNYLFKACSSLSTVNLSNSDFKGCGNVNYFFSNCPLLSKVTMNNVDLRKCTNFNNMFDQCSVMTHVTMQGIHIESATNLSFLARSTITNLDLSGAYLNGVTTLKSCFSNATNLVDVNFSGVNLEKCISTEEMFSNKAKLKTINFSSVSLDVCGSTKKMFYNCVKLEVINMNGFETPACTDMSYMFERCYSVTSVDLSGWKTGSVKDMSRMFWEFAVNRDNNRTSKQYITVDISSFNFNSLENCSYMFNTDIYTDFVKTIILPSDPGDAKALKLKNAERMFRKRVHLENIVNLELLTTTSALTNTTSMFSECNMLITIDISSMNLSGVTSTQWMFNAAKNQTADRLTTIYVSDDPSYAFNSSIITNSSDMFTNRKNLVGQNGTTCNGTDNVTITYARIDTDDTPGYFSVKPAGG